MKNIWILNANKSGAHIFYKKLGVEAELIQIFKHPEGAMKESELNSDRPGRFRYQELNREKSSVKHKVEKFAKDLSLYLEKGRAENRFEKLILIAGPKFNGILMSKFNKRLKHSIAKNVVKEIISSNKKKLEIIEKIIVDNKQLLY